MTNKGFTKYDQMRKFMDNLNERSLGISSDCCLFDDSGEENCQNLYCLRTDLSDYVEYVREHLEE